MYYSYKIRLLEPVKMGSQMKSDNTEYALNYIAGTALRGAFVNAYLRAEKLNLDEDKALKKLLLKDMYFLNAYPVAGDERTIPAPLCFMAGKKELNDYEGQDLAVKSVFDDTDKTGDKVVKKEPFVQLEDTTVHGVKVKKEFRLHISVNGRDEKAERALFRYESIAPGQEFIGLIRLEEAIGTDKALANAKVKAFLSMLENLTVYVGGSKGSGYGRCQVTGLGTVDEEVVMQDQAAKEQEFYVYFLSDAILMNQDGTMASAIPEDYLQQKLGLKTVKKQSGAADSVRITGYNSTWGKSLPQFEGIKAGSIFRYSWSGEWSEEKVKALRDQGVGLRRQEGFGRILILRRMDYRVWNRYEEKKDGDSWNGAWASEEVKTQAQQLLKALYREKVLRGIDHLVVQEAAKVSNFRLTRAQLGKILELTQHANYESADKAQMRFEEYFRHMEEKRNNLAAFRAFTGTRIGDRNMSEYILDLIWTVDQVPAFTQKDGFGKLELDGLVYEPDRAAVKEYNLMFLEKFVRYLLRDISKKGGK